MGRKTTSNALTVAGGTATAPVANNNTSTSGNHVDKAGKFRQLAERRVTQALRIINRIGNLSNKSSYEFTAEQIGKMFEAMRNELTEAEDRFNRAVKPRQLDFNL